MFPLHKKIKWNETLQWADINISMQISSRCSRATIKEKLSLQFSELLNKLAYSIFTLLNNVIVEVQTHRVHFSVEGQEERQSAIHRKHSISGKYVFVQNMFFSGMQFLKSNFLLNNVMLPGIIVVWTMPGEHAAFFEPYFLEPVMFSIKICTAVWIYSKQEC